MSYSKFGDQVAWNSDSESCAVLGERQLLSYFDWRDLAPFGLRRVLDGRLTPGRLTWSECRVRIRLL